jgi:hypothetical protein
LQPPTQKKRRLQITADPQEYDLENKKGWLVGLSLATRQGDEKKQTQAQANQ